MKQVRAIAREQEKSIAAGDKGGFAGCLAGIYSHRQREDLSMIDSTADNARNDIDRPNVLVFPPVIPLCTVVVAAVLQWFMPPGLVAFIDSGWRLVSGAAVTFLGLLMASAGKRALLRHGTNVSPSHPTTALVTDGVFQRTRNPLYVGVSAAICGLALIFALDWVLLLMIPAFVLMHFAVVRSEESYLEGKFGEAYRNYQERVPRYLGF
jgi:protein-S-isoprenylcysteine O-methyltransferase Ste14